jgi:hypothetical protein
VFQCGYMGCMHVWLHVCVNFKACVYTCKYTCTYLRMHACTYVCTHAYTHTHALARPHAHPPAESINAPLLGRQRSNKVLCGVLRAMIPPTAIHTQRHAHTHTQTNTYISSNDPRTSRTYECIHHFRPYTLCMHYIFMQASN